MLNDGCNTEGSGFRVDIERLLACDLHQLRTEAILLRAELFAEPRRVAVSFDEVVLASVPRSSRLPPVWGFTTARAAGVPSRSVRPPGGAEKMSQISHLAL
jgi:hypothetical protein